MVVAKQAVGILVSHAWKQPLLELGLSTSSTMLTYGFEGELTEDSLTRKLGGRSVVVSIFFFKREAAVSIPLQGKA